MSNAKESRPRITLGILIGSWAITVVLGYAVFGRWLGFAIEGMDLAHLSKLPLIVGPAALLVSLILTVIWARGIAPASAASGQGDADSAGLGRRRFMLGLGAGTGGVVATVAAVLGRNFGWMTITGPNIGAAVPTHAENPDPSWQGARVRAYRRLGRTGFEVSDIALGSGQIRGELGEKVARAAIERGVNYFDTAPDYSAAGSELALGRAMRGHREKMFLATKFCTPNGNLPAGTSVADYMSAVEGSLERLQTDYVDLVHVHSCDTVERLMDPNVHEAFDRLKEQGKVRFLGFSSHTPNLEAVADAAIESNRFDVMMLAYHHGAWPRLGEIIDRAAEIDMGFVAMKTLKGAKHRGLMDSRAEQDSYSQAAFKWVLQNPNVSCLVISFSELQHVDEYLYASGKAFGNADQAMLERYDALIAGKHCLPHCGACLDQCPEGLPIHDVLRHRMYFQDYGHEREAMRLYSRLPIKADVCGECDAPCANACPVGVPIPEFTRQAHRMLTLEA